MIIYKIHLNLDNNNKVIDLNRSLSLIIALVMLVMKERKVGYTIEVMIRKFLILNKALF